MSSTEDIAGAKKYINEKELTEITANKNSKKNTKDTRKSGKANNM